MNNIHFLKNNEYLNTFIKEIIKSKDDEDSFYICNVSDIVYKYKRFKQLLPRVQPFYAVKCNDVHSVLVTLAELGAHFDCASKSEIHSILSLGVPPSKIIFANPVKQPHHLRYAAALGVDLMTFDGEQELYKAKKLFPTARLVLRIRYDDQTAVENFSKKFGCNHKTEAPKLIDLAIKLGLNVVGVSFHIGTGSKNNTIYKEAIAASRYVFDYAENVGLKFNILDIGGGFPERADTFFEKIASTINDALDLYFPSTSVDIIAEPGRYFVATAFTLCCNILSKRLDTNNQFTYFINDGIFGNFNIVHIEKKIVTPIILNPDNAKKELVLSNIWGYTANNYDHIVKDVLLPEFNAGDWLAFENMGAYSIVISTNFHNFPKSIVHVEGSKEFGKILNVLS